MQKKYIKTPKDTSKRGPKSKSDKIEHEYTIEKIKERCAIEACYRVTTVLNTGRNSLLLENSLESLKSTVFGVSGSVKAAEKEKPFEKVCAARLCDSNLQGKKLKDIALFKLNFSNDTKFSKEAGNITWRATKFETSDYIILYYKYYY